MVYTEALIISKLKSYQRQKRDLNLLSYELNFAAVCGSLSGDDSDSSSFQEACYSEFMRIQCEVNRLEHYVQLLPDPLQDVINQFYFLQKPWSDIQENMFISGRTLIRYRNEAVRQLVEMYNYASSILPGSVTG